METSLRFRCGATWASSGAPRSMPTGPVCDSRAGLHSHLAGGGAGQPIVLEGGRSAALSRDGSRVSRCPMTVSSECGGSVRRGTAGDPIVLRGHSGAVYGAEFSPDGSRIVTVSADSTARVWTSAGTGNPVVLLGHTAEVWTVAFDGRAVALSRGPRTGPSAYGPPMASVFRRLAEPQWRRGERGVFAGRIANRHGVGGRDRAPVAGERWQSHGVGEARRGDRECRLQPRRVARRGRLGRRNRRGVECLEKRAHSF